MGNQMSERSPYDDGDKFDPDFSLGIIQRDAQPCKRVAYIWDERTLLHRSNNRHVERPQRQTAIRNILQKEGLEPELQILSAREATMEELSKGHDPIYIQHVIDTCANLAVGSDQNKLNEGSLDGDTYINQFSATAARVAAGSLIDTCDAVMSGSADNGLCIIRPPGHHAEYDHAKGFCLFNNAVIAAKVMQEKYGIGKMMIIDWDVHHGNGIEHMTYDSESIFYFSIHAWCGGMFYPGTGDPENDGEGIGKGKNVNVPMEFDMGDREYFRVFQDILLPIAREYQPEFILVSAGFDATIKDPLGDMRVTPPAWGVMTHCLLNIQPKLVCVLEGGYNLQTTSQAVAYVAQTLLYGQFVSDYHRVSVSYDPYLESTIPDLMKNKMNASLRSVLKAHGNNWPILLETIKVPAEPSFKDLIENENERPDEPDESDENVQQPMMEEDEKVDLFDVSDLVESIADLSLVADEEKTIEFKVTKAQMITVGMHLRVTPNLSDLSAQWALSELGPHDELEIFCGQIGKIVDIEDDDDTVKLQWANMDSDWLPYLATFTTMNINATVPKKDDDGDEDVGLLDGVEANPIGLAASQLESVQEGDEAKIE